MARSVGACDAYCERCCSRHQLEKEGLGDVPQKMLDELERVFELKFEKGYNPNIRFLAHLFEPLRSVYRPFLFYILTEFSGGQYFK